MARGQQPRPQSGSVIAQKIRIDNSKKCEEKRVEQPPVSPSKMVQGIADEEEAEEHRQPGQRVRGYTLQSYTTVQVTNRQKPLPGYPPNYCHDPLSTLPPPGYPLDYVSRKVQVVCDNRGRLKKNIVTQQPQSGAAATPDDAASRNASDSTTTPPAAASCQRPTTLEDLSLPQSTKPYVPPGVLGPGCDEYSTTSRTAGKTSGSRSNCTTPGSYSAEWNYEFVHEKSFDYIEALKYSSRDAHCIRKEDYINTHAPPPLTGNPKSDVTNGSTNVEVGRSNVEIYEYLDSEVLANALGAMPCHGMEYRTQYYGSVKEKKKRSREGKKSWIESHLNSSSSSSDEKVKSHFAMKTKNVSHPSKSRINGASDQNDAEVTTTTTTTEGLGSSSGPDVSSTSSSITATKQKMDRKIASTSKLTGILSRLSPKLIHRRSSSTSKILLTGNDANRSKNGASNRREGESEDRPSNADVSTSGISVDGPGADLSSESHSSSSNPRRGRSPVRNFFRGKGTTSNNDAADGNDAKSTVKSKSPARNRFLTSFRSSSSHKDKDSHKDDKSDTSSMTSQFSLSRRLRKSGRDELVGNVASPPSSNGDGNSLGNSNGNSRHNGNFQQQRICQSEGAILVSSGGGRRYHVVEIPIDDDDDVVDSLPSASKSSGMMRGDADIVEMEENPEEEVDIPTRPTCRHRQNIIPPPLPPHGAPCWVDKSGLNQMPTPPASLKLSKLSAKVGSADANVSKRSCAGTVQSSRVPDVSIGDCSIDMNASTGSTTVADESLDYEDDPRIQEFFGSQATLEPDPEVCSVYPTLSGANARSTQNQYRGVFVPGTGGFQSSNVRDSHSPTKIAPSSRFQSTPNAANNAVLSNASSRLFSPMSPAGSSLCSSSLSSQPIPVVPGVCFGEETSLSSSVASPIGGGGGGGAIVEGKQNSSINSNSIGSPPTEPSSSSYTSQTSGSRKPSYLSISMSVSGYSHYRRTGTSLSLQPGRTFSTSSLASRGSGSLASVGSSAFSYSTNDASHAGTRAREASGGSGVGGGCGWRGSSVPPTLCRDNVPSGLNPRPNNPEDQIIESSAADMIPLSTCLMDKLCMGCGPASPPSTLASSRLHDAKIDKCTQPNLSYKRPVTTSVVKENDSSNNASHSAAPSSTKATSDPSSSSSSSSSSSRRDSRAGPFAVSSQRHTVIRLSPDDPSTATLSTSAETAERPSSEMTVTSQVEERSRGSLEGVSGAAMSARESVVLEAREIVERIKRAERNKLTEERRECEERENTDDDLAKLEHSKTETDERVEKSDVGDIQFRDDEGQLEICNDNGDVIVEESGSKNGKYFLKVVDIHETKIRDICVELESLLTRDSNGLSSDASVATATTIGASHSKDSQVPEEACGKLRACIGKANLLTSKKFKQFKGLCEKNMAPAGSEPFPTTNDDLAGFWDTVMIQVEEIYSMHRGILRLKENGWTAEEKETKKMTKRPVKPRTKEEAGVAAAAARAKPRTKEEAGVAAAAAAARAKAREDARKKLINSKRMQHKQKVLLETRD